MGISPIYNIIKSVATRGIETRTQINKEPYIKAIIQQVKKQHSLFLNEAIPKLEKS